MWQGHERIDQRSMALHAAYAEKLSVRPELFAIVEENLRKQAEMGGRSLPYTRAWEELLKRPWNEVRTLMVEDSEKMRAMRQASPFAGVLTPKERWAIFERFALTATGRE